MGWCVLRFVVIRQTLLDELLYKDLSLCELPGFFLCGRFKPGLSISFGLGVALVFEYLYWVCFTVGFVLHFTHCFWILCFPPVVSYFMAQFTIGFEPIFLLLIAVEFRAVFRDLACWAAFFILHCFYISISMRWTSFLLSSTFLLKRTFPPVMI